MRQIYKVADCSGYSSCVNNENAGLQHMGLDMLRLGLGEGWVGQTGEDEFALVCLSGKCSIAIHGEKAVDWSGVGGRANVFAGSPEAAYVPRRTEFRVVGESEVEIAVFRARCDADLEPVLVRSADVVVVSAGIANWRRDVRLIFPPGTGKTGRLIVGETLNPPGNWSGFPPHKHDCLSEEEFPLEEIYLFKARPADGYGVQLIYGGKEGDLAKLVGNDDVAVFRSGYHPTVSSPGVQLNYTWALGGNDRVYKVYVDPRYRWLTGTEAVLRESGKYYGV